MEEKLADIREKFQSRRDREYWNLYLSHNCFRITIEMRTNDNYLKKTNTAYPIRLEKEIGLNDDPFIDEVFSEHTNGGCR